MFSYLEKFKNLSPDLREAVSSARATQVISELEKKYGIDLDALVIKIMVKEVSWSGLAEFLVQEHHLSSGQAEVLQAELAERLFKPAEQYLGISAQPTEVSETFPRKGFRNLPVAPVDEPVERVLPQVLQKAGITDGQ